MKKVKINFGGFWEGFNPCDNLFYNILKERYEVEISDKPDYVFYSSLGEPFGFTKYEGVRILFTGENESVDFTAFDYAIGFDYMSFGERYIRYPLAIYARSGPRFIREEMTEEKARKILENKKIFCNFVYGHESYSKKRELLFKMLSAYKHVESAGTFLNNQSDGKNVRGESKFKLLFESKFTICGESVEYPGFVTEKIIHAYENYSIPIYAGDPMISEMFNEASFIKLSNFENVNELVDYVSEVDNNDDLYIKMLMEPVTSLPNFETIEYDKLKKFIYNIFDQNIKDAYRRMRCYKSAEHNQYLKEYSKFYNTMEYKILKRIKRF